METARDHVAETLLILGKAHPANDGHVERDFVLPRQAYYAVVEHLTKARKQLDDAALAATRPARACPDCGRPTDLLSRAEHDANREAPEGWNPDDTTVST